MKKLISLLLGIAMITMGASLAEGALVTYFSHAGENYNVGVIEEGNTAKLAKVIAEQTGRPVTIWQSVGSETIKADWTR